MTNLNISPPISVIVFVRNAAATIDRALKSTVAQRVAGLELIVLDAGSTDGTVDVIRKYEDQIAFWRSAPDGGATEAINEGVQRARGDVICLLPADDWLEPGALARVTQEFQSDPELDVLSCGTRIVHFEPDGSMRVDASFVSPELLEFSLPKILRHPLTAGRFMRRRVYKRFGGHGADYRFGDFDFLVRVCLGGAKAKTLPVLTYTYVRHAKSSTLSGNAENLSAMADDSIKVAEEHLVRTDLNSIDRKALVALHGRASARLASALCRDGRLRRAAEIVLRAMRVNPAWPLCIPVWMVKGALERARLSRIARSESAEGP